MTERTQKFWTTEEKATAHDLKALKCTDREIAEILGRTKNSVNNFFSRERKNEASPKVGRYSRWTEEEKATAYALRKKGYSCREIGVCIGRSGGSVDRILRIRGNAEKESQEECRFYWAEEDFAAAERMRKEGTPPMEIAGKIDERTTERKKRPKKETKKKPKKESQWMNTICWTCKNAIVNCKKPVEGFTAEKKPYFVQRGTLVEGRKEFLGYSYLVKECPNYEPEPYAEEGKKWI